MIVAVASPAFLPILPILALFSVFGFSTVATGFVFVFTHAVLLPQICPLPSPDCGAGKAKLVSSWPCPAI